MAIVAVRDKITEATRLLELVARRSQEGIDNPIQTRILGIYVLEKPVEIFDPVSKGKLGRKYCGLG